MDEKVGVHRGCLTVRALLFQRQSAGLLEKLPADRLSLVLPLTFHVQLYTENLAACLMCGPKAVHF